MIRRVALWTALTALAAVLGACAGHGAASTSGVLPQAGSPAFNTAKPSPSPVPVLPEYPVVYPQNHVATISLQAGINIATELPAFFWEGQAGIAPTIFVNPGDTIVLDLLNSLPGPGSAGDVNLHFHGLTVSPKRPADDVLTMLAMPGQTLHYVVPIPKTQEPGLYWYHPHVFGQTDAQVGKDGMSGAIVVGGLERRVRGLANMKARVIIVRATGLTDNGARNMDEQQDMRQQQVVTNKPCVGEPGYTVSLNGAVKPIIPFAPGESQLFRVINATGHKTLKLAVDNEQLQLVATDGVALGTYPGTGPTETLPFIILPPAGRAEFVVTAPSSGTAKFRTKCYYSGPGGDPDPEIELGTLQTTGKALRGRARPVTLLAASTSPNSDPLPPPATTRTITLSEGPNLMFINGKSFKPGDPPMYVAKSGTVEKWIVSNVTQEVHDFHVHQVHFVVSAIDGVPVSHPFWADSVVVPHELDKRPGTITLLVDFRNPIVRGTFMFHCHILDHEDRGMMATIRVD
jgi:FtsP/CotA-like multicopper oxidase with cupredoxin domain